MVSAVKVQGKRLYEIARAGKRNHPRAKDSQNTRTINI